MDIGFVDEAYFHAVGRGAGDVGEFLGGGVRDSDLRIVVQLWVPWRYACCLTWLLVMRLSSGGGLVI